MPAGSSSKMAEDTRRDNHSGTVGGLFNPSMQQHNEFNRYFTEAVDITASLSDDYMRSTVIPRSPSPNLLAAPPPTAHITGDNLGTVYRGLSPASCASSMESKVASSTARMEMVRPVSIVVPQATDDLPNCIKVGPIDSGSSSSEGADLGNGNNGNNGTSDLQTHGHRNSKGLISIIHPFKNTIAGAGAGLVSSIVTCPLDVVKTRLQYQGVLREKFREQGFKPYRGTVNTLTRIFAEEGTRGLYRGLAPMMMGYLPTWGIYFTAYEGLKTNTSKTLDFPQTHALVHVLSAMGAGATSSMLTNPIWVLKSRFMTQSVFTDYQYTSIVDAVRRILHNEGWRGFYKGLGSSLLGVTHVAVQFPLYEQLKKWLHVDSQVQNIESSRILFASAVSKMVASSVTYPHEVIRTRLQNQTREPYKYRGIVHAVGVIYKEEGVLAFYRGLSTNLIRTVPASMMTLLTYELLVRIL